MSDIPLRSLTELQREIMEVIWERKEATVADVWDAMTKRRELARNTVQTMMARLEAKGWLTHREVGQAFVYSAKIPRRTSLGAKVAQLVDGLFAGSPAQMVMALMEYRGLSPKEAQRIVEMIEASETKPRRPKRKGTE